MTAKDFFEKVRVDDVKKIKINVKNVFVCILALAIPALLVLNVLQAKQYAQLENDTKEIECRQYEVIEQNKRLVAEISKLSSPDRIEWIATNNLQMEKASPEDIIRVEIKDKDKN